MRKWCRSWHKIVSFNSQRFWNRCHESRTVSAGFPGRQLNVRKTLSISQPGMEKMTRLMPGLELRQHELCSERESIVPACQGMAFKFHFKTHSRTWWQRRFLMTQLFHGMLREWKSVIRTKIWKMRTGRQWSFNNGLVVLITLPALAEAQAVGNCFFHGMQRAGIKKRTPNYTPRCVERWRRFTRWTRNLPNWMVKA